MSSESRALKRGQWWDKSIAFVLATRNAVVGIAVACWVVIVAAVILIPVSFHHERRRVQDWLDQLEWRVD